MENPVNTNQSLDMQLTKLGFWSAVTLIVTGVLSTFLPLDIPAGVSAEHTANSLVKRE